MSGILSARSVDGEHAALSPAVLEAAAQWFATLGADTVAEGDRQRWQAWHDASAEHARAWRAVLAISREFDAAAGTPGGEVLSQAGRYRRRSLKRWAWLIGVALAGGGVIAQPDSRRYLAALGSDLHTGVGEIRQFVLSDGTQAWLNTRSAVNLRYSDSLRLIELVAGEILIETAKDAARPFEVATPAGRLRALGTRFRVRLEDDRTRLDVFEGAVAVRPPRGGQACTVPAGRGASPGEAGCGFLGAAEPANIAWQRHELVAVDMPLRDFLDELGRYVHGYLGCDDAVADLRLVGVYPLNDPDRIFKALEGTLPVRVRRPLPWWVRVEPAQEFL